MFENQEGITYVEGFCIVKSLMKGKRLQWHRMRKSIKWKESHEYSVNNSCHCWCVLRAPEYWAVWVRCGKTDSTYLHPLDSLAQKIHIKI